MLTAEGCGERRKRFLERLDPDGPVLLGDPVHVRYLTGFGADPVSLNADFGGLLRLTPDGQATLYFDNRLAKAAEAAFVNERVPFPWYDGKSPGQGPRRMVLKPAVDAGGTAGRVHDSLIDPVAPLVLGILTDLRRAKDDDEVALIQSCCRAAEAGQAWARQAVRPGMTELAVYAGITAVCNQAAGKPVVVYGDFAVSPGPARRGGPPTAKVIEAGETLILDFSVVIDGYRCDFTNTLVVGAEPTAEQRRMFDLCVAAMAAGERHLRAGVHGQEAYNAVRTVFQDAGVADAFPHHAGHGLGLGHPEAPFLVRESLETLVAGDVVTLEPGLYIDDIGGIRIEHNYLVTESGYERLSQHEIALK